MVKINEHYLKLTAGYLFPEIARRVKIFAEKNPRAQIIRLGIGDVTLPLAPAVVEAARGAFAEMANADSFRGYGPEQGYEFLRLAIAQHDYSARGVNISPDEIFVSDGAKCDTGNIQEIFSADCTVAVPDPVYPVYVDTNVMAGRTDACDSAGKFGRLIYLPCTRDNGFLPEPPSAKADVIYLCSPNNPTGAAATRENLTGWVQYARAHDAVILFDAAYEAFITDTHLPRSIFEIEGARDCAIEFRSFSKTAGFTGTRSAFTVVPKTLMGKKSSGDPVSLHALWLRRQTTKFNGVSYPIQRATEACYSTEGRKQIAEQTAYYLGNAQVILEGLAKLGLEIHGGVNAPYVWLKTPHDMKSWDFFDKCLRETHVVGTPGAGFGPCGEGYFRLSAFGSRKNVTVAVTRIQNKLSL